MKRTFQVTVTQTTDVTVEIDDASFDEAAMAEFRESFYPLFDLKQHAEHIAQYAVRSGSPGFLEGYGPVKYRGTVSHWEGDKRAEPTYDINLIVGDEDVDTDCWETTGK